MKSDDDVVLFERYAEHIAIVTLNRPEKRNAVNLAVANRIAECVRTVEQDDSIRVAILTGAGSVFCAGGDISEMTAGRGGSTIFAEGGFAGFVYAKRRKPWIAAARGAVLGGGLELCLACDLIVVSEGSQLGLPEVKRGVVALAGGVVRLQASIPRVMANEIILTGDPVPARTALGLGLVNRVVPGNEVLGAAIELADRIVCNSPLATYASLDISRNTKGLNEEDALAYAGQVFGIVRNSQDFLEGTRAFVERRKPQWTGR